MTESRKTRIIVINSRKGGVLKTSLTTNLAGSLSRRGKKVLIVDTDPQGNCLATFWMNPDIVQRNIFTVMLEGLEPRKATISVPKTNIDIIGSNDDMDDFEFEVTLNLESYANPLAIMKQALEPIVDNYDYILIDTPPAGGLIQGNVFYFADSVIIPYQPEVYAMRALVKTITKINEFKGKYNPNLTINGVIGTIVDLRTNIHVDSLQECKKFCDKEGINVYDIIVPKSIRYANSVAYKKMPLTLDDRHAELYPFAECYHALATELINQEDNGGNEYVAATTESIQNGDRPSSWFKRIFR